MHCAQGLPRRDEDVAYVAQPFSTLCSPPAAISHLQPMPFTDTLEPPPPPFSSFHSHTLTIPFRLSGFKYSDRKTEDSDIQ